MRLAAATILASISWSACSTATPAPAADIEPGQNFSLRAGESAQTRDKALRVGFVEVTADSRCPKGAQCVWAGDASVRVWLQRGNGPMQALDLHTAANAAQAVRVLDHELRLVRLDPYPVNGKAIAKADYVATLTLQRGSTTEPER